MTINGTLAESTVATLTAQSQFNDIIFVVAYESDIKPTPINKPIVALSVNGCEIGEKLTKTLETGEIVETNNRNMETTLSADIYLPYSMGGSAGHKIFDRLATYFLFTKNKDIIKISCDEAEYNSSCEAIVLHIRIVFNNIISA